MGKKVFFSRGMDDLDAKDILAREAVVANALKEMGMDITNPFSVDDNRRGTIKGIFDIVEDDLEKLKNSDFLIADLSLPNRSYVGAMFELAKAYELGKEIYVWVGDNNIINRIWLQYHANCITRSFEEIKEILFLCYTDKGRALNEKRIIDYYSDIHCIYDEKEKEDFFHQFDQRKTEKYSEEYGSLYKWFEEIDFHGTVIDIGCGTSQWAPLLVRNAQQVVCFDASSKMLEYSISKNPYPNIEYHQGNYLDNKWMENFFANYKNIDFIIITFVLNLITLEQQNALIGFLKKKASGKTRIVIVENQSSLFSTTGYFCRTEIQSRKGTEKNSVFDIRKRNFLHNDLKKALTEFGTIENTFRTNNYFAAGIAVSN